MFERSVKVMIHRKQFGVAAVSIALAGSLVACSSTGGRKALEQSSNVGADGARAKTMTVTMITHQAPGDTFWVRCLIPSGYEVQ